MKAKPGAIPVATAGVTSAGHNAMELIAKATGVTYRHVTYDGGNPAVVATVAGEAEVTTQLAVEQADMIRGKRLRPLATVSDKALELEGFGSIPPLSATPARLHRAGQLLRHLHSQGRARRGGEDGREDLGRATSPRARRSRSTPTAAAPCSRPRPARRRRRRCSRPCRPTPGCSSTAARPRSRPTRSAFRSPERRRRGRPMTTTTEGHGDGAPPSPAELQAQAASDLRDALGWLVFGVGRAHRLDPHGPARGAAHQSVHRARPAARAARPGDAPASASCWPCAAGAAARGWSTGRGSRSTGARCAGSAVVIGPDPRLHRGRCSAAACRSGSCSALYVAASIVLLAGPAAGARRRLAP